jgi:cytochrome c
MTFAGLGNEQARANLILYMRENGGGPPLPEPPAAEPAEGDAGAAAGPEAEAGADAAGAAAMPEPVADESGATANE